MEDERHVDLPKDDASIEILSEGGDSHTRDSEWSIYSPGRSSIAGSEMSLMDLQKLSIHSKMAPIVHQDGRQFIERRNLDDGGLPYSAEFYLNGEVWKLSGEDCLLMSPRWYIAMVNVDGTVNFDGSNGFEEAIQTLLRHLKVMNVLLDKELEECNKTKSALIVTLNKLADESGENIDRKRDVMLIRMLLKKHGNSLSIDFKQDLRNCSRLSSEIMSTLDNYVTKALKLIQRNEFLGHLNGSSITDEFINDAIMKALNSHRDQLAAICSSSMKNILKEIPDDHILYVSMDDMHLFTDLTTLDCVIFETVLPMISSKFLSRVQEISDKQFVDPDPLSNRIFLYVCKSLQEVTQQLAAHIKTDNVIIYSEAIGWEVTVLQEERQTSYSKCLRQQLQMLAKLANHFEPGGPFLTCRFPYEFKLFQNIDAIPESVRIWLCLLDDCMKDLVQADLDKMQMLSCFFKSYVSFIASGDFQSETLECLWTIAHGALRSLADMASSQEDRIFLDSVSLGFNQMINRCLNKFPREQFGNECDQIEITLQKIICKAEDMNVSSDELSKFSNVFSQLLNDLSDLQLEWLIRSTSSDKCSHLLQGQFIVPVDSIWKNTEYECFKVVNLKGFEEMYKALHNSEETPKHYQLNVIQVLLQNVEKLTSKQNWSNGKRLSDKDLLGAMTYMINSIRDSLALLNDQSDYHCFEDFLLMMSQVIKEEVKDFIHIDSIDYEETLDPLLDRFEGSISKVLLKSGLKLYTTQYNKYITESARLSREKRIKKIVSDVRFKMNRRINLVKNWTEEFKLVEVPEVLAGLSAVWSIIVSENDCNLEKKTKPSLLQISCILSIFGDKKNHTKGDSHKLLQLSTQEGKEFVLGLTAALLALYGHKVKIVCFNSHLTRIYSLDWIRVFRRFSILSNICYESFYDMAWERSRRICENYTAYINECFGFGTNSNNADGLKNSSEDERCVLLIEDIDIILQLFYLTFPFHRYLTSPTIPGLEDVQRKLFCPNEPLDGNEIDQYIKHSINPNIRKLRAFLDRPHSYTILEGDFLDEVEYTNKTLFSKHLDAMKRVKPMEDRYNWCSEFYMQVMEDNSKYGYLPFAFIGFPYPSLLKSFPRVLSFTSAPLNVSDEILNFAIKFYGIYHTISESNVFQTIPTQFDTEQDFLYVDSEDDRDWMEAIIVAIKAAIERNCLVLVFFNDVQKMEQVEQSEHLKELNVAAIKTASYKEHLIPVEIFVLIVCKGYFTKDRQVHVVQTFFSYEGKEEDLIRRQAERSGKSGSYELIIPSNSKYPRKEDVRRRTYAWCVQKKRGYLFAEKMKEMSDNNSKEYNKLNKFLRLRT